jgi:hypothetical protein
MASIGAVNVKRLAGKPEYSEKTCPSATFSAIKYRTVRMGRVTPELWRCRYPIHVVHENHMQFIETTSSFTFCGTEQAVNVEPVEIQPAIDDSLLADFSTLKMEAIRSSETLVYTRFTRRHIP